MEDELELYQNAAEEQMQNSVAHLDDTLQHIRAGKANPRILDPIKVDYYGAMSPLANCATITTPDARTIAITPWEKKLISEIERAIINSNIGLAPSNNGETIRLILPPPRCDRGIQKTRQERPERRHRERCRRRDAEDPR